MQPVDPRTRLEVKTDPRARLEGMTVGKCLEKSCRVGYGEKRLPHRRLDGQGLRRAGG